MTSDTTVPFQAASLDDALAEYELAREEGRPLGRQEFLAAHAAFASELAALLDAAEAVDRLARPVREALGGRPPLHVPAPDGYEMLEEIGRGGMGVVFKARQRGTEQLVALKLLRPDWLAGLDADSRRLALEQFRVEARAAASLRHPNRVRILHLGEHQGCPYYAMELIEGCSLAEKMKRPPGVGTEEAVRYLAAVAEALEEAHARGVLHRDIKPHNLLIDQRSGQALLADFGLAMIGAGADGLGRQAGVAGTLPYMAPEQTEGGAGATPLSDVYGLGATLYEVLTGGPPFRGGTRAEITARIRTEAPAPLSQLRPGVSPELEAICLRCLEKDPARRFQSAGELAAALDGFLDSIHYVRQFAGSGTRMLVSLPIALVPHLTVFWMLQAWFVEPLAWAALFSAYPILFTTLWLQDRAWRPKTTFVGRPTYWPTWIGNLFAAVVIAVALRVTLHDDPRRVILLMYPVLAALNGMAYFVEASKLPAKLRWGPFGFWLTGLVMLAHLPWAPIFYCAFAVVGYLAYGSYFLRLGRELGGGSSEIPAHNPPTGPA